MEPTNALPKTVLEPQFHILLKCKKQVSTECRRYHPEKINYL